MESITILANEVALNIFESVFCTVFSSMILVIFLGFFAIQSAALFKNI